MTRSLRILLAILANAAPLLAQTAPPDSNPARLVCIVRDETGAPVEGANLTLASLGVGLTGVTDAQGRYEFQGVAPGAYRLTAVLPGFGRQADHIALAPGGTEESVLTLRLLSLEELVASASKVVRKAREAPATVHVISESMIRERGYMYLYDALREAPGFDIVWMGGLYGPILMPRGLDQQENNKLLLLVDGVVDNNLSAGTAQVYMQYSLHNVKRIEIIYGPASALYGANAMSGLVNIITKTGEDLKGVRLQAGGMAWDTGFRRTGGTAGIAAGKAWGAEGGKIDLSASFHVVNTDGPDLMLEDGVARSDKPADPGGSAYYFSPDHIGSAERGTYMAQAKARFERIGLSLGGYLWQHDGGQGTYGHEGFVFLNGLQNKPDVWNFRNWSANASLTRPMGKLSNTLSVIYRNTQLVDGFDVYFDRTGTGPNGAGTPPVSGSRYFRPDHSFKVDDNVSWEVSTGMTVVAGVSAEFQRVSDYDLCPGTACPPGTTGTVGHSFADQNLIAVGPKPIVDETRQYDYKDFSGYLEHTWNVSEKLSLTTGLRLDSFKLTGDSTPLFFGTRDTDASGNCPSNRPDCRTAAQAAAAGAREVSRVYYLFEPYDKTRTSFNPRLGAVFTPVKDRFTLKALYGEGFRMPTVRELFSVSGSRYANPDLGSEKIRTGELSGTWQLAEDRGVVEVDAFYTKAADIILLTPSAVIRPGRTTFLNQFLNVAEPKIWGVELKSTLRASSSIDLFGQYTYERPEYERIDPGNRSHVPDTAVLTDGSNDIPRQARHKGLVGLTLSVWNRRLVITPRMGFVSSRPEIITAVLQEVPAYQTLDVSVSARDLGFRGLSATLAAYNLTNEDILDPGFRTANKSNDFPAAHPQPGTRFFLRLSYQKSF